jgi:hypothetical protein
MDMYGSGSRRAKMTHKKSEEISVVLKCWMFSIEGWRLLCSLDVHHEGPKINYFNYCKI